MGLRLRLILVLMIPPLLVVGAYGIVRVRAERDEVLSESARQMALTVQAIQIAVENALRDRQVADIKRLLEELVEHQEQIDRIRVFDRALAPIVVSNPLSIGEDVSPAALQRVIDSGRGEVFYRDHGREPVLYSLVPLRGPQGAVNGAIEVVQLAAAAAHRSQSTARDIWVRLAVLLVSGSVLTGLLLQRQVLSPLFRLMEGIQRLGRLETGPPLPVERRDEIGRVAEAFNAMAARLDEARRRLLAETERAIDLEQQLRQAETLAVAGRLATGLAHEVGTPLNIISGRAEFLMHTLPENDRRRAELEVIVTQIDRITGIIRSLLDMVRPQKAAPQPVAPGRVIDQLLPLLRHAARRRGVSLETAIPAEVPAVLADPNHLQQVLINLLMNALEATPAGGRVRLLAAPDVRHGRPGVEMSVADNGAGMAPEVRARVFEPFFTTKPRGQGTGLGLPICRDIVREHGGEIVVDSQPDRGTTVTVWLPAAGGNP